jgi:hypothetical protein
VTEQLARVPSLFCFEGPVRDPLGQFATWAILGLFYAEKKVMNELPKAHDEAAPQPNEIAFAEFLEGTPPSEERQIKDLFEENPFEEDGERALNTPQLLLHCSTETCNGPRVFRNFGAEVATLSPIESGSYF